MEQEEDQTSDPRRVAREFLVGQMARLAEGDKDALAEVYRLTSAKLNALLSVMLKDRAITEEVLQDVYLTAWRQSASFDARRGSPMTWLITIARNKAIDKLRARKTQAPLTPIEKLDLVDPGPSVVDALTSVEEQRSLLHCVGKLEENQQNVIRAVFYGGLTYEALAVREGIPVGTMKSRIRRMLLKLRACMDAGNS